MKLLHTSDWHVGKAVRGHSRADEHREVLAEITAIAGQEEVDLIVVAGDLYETAAPSAQSEAIVNRALLDLAEVAPVVAVAGNHDNARRLAAVAPLYRLGRVTMATEPRAPADGGRISLDLETGRVQIALLPFVSQRAIVRAGQLMDQAGFENAQTYADRMRRVLAALSADFSADDVNLIVSHAFVHGANPGGGERMAHLVDEYGLSAVDFPASAAYVALGHLHRAQQMLGSTTIHYSGSPLQLDFGESEEPKQVNIVDLEPGLPAKVTARVLAAGRPLRTISGSLADVEARAQAMEVEELERAWFRVRLDEPSRTGLADEVRALLGAGVVDIRVERPAGPKAHRVGSDRSPQQLFADYLAQHNIVDPALEKRFMQLHEDCFEVVR